MLSHMLRAEDFTGVALDRRYDPILDIATDEGFKVFRVAQRRLMPHCLAWWGIECKTWVWMCRATYGRTKDVPLGKIVAILVEDKADIAAFANWSPASEGSAPAQAQPAPA